MEQLRQKAAQTADTPQDRHKDPRWCAVCGFQKFLSTTPSCLSKTDFATIQGLLNDIQHCHPKSHTGGDCMPLPNIDGFLKKRGIATPESYGTWRDDGSLRDRLDPNIRVRLLKCPHCQFITRIKHKYIVEMQVTCLLDATGKESPYVDITQSTCTTALSRDKAFIRFRSHIRQCMKNLKIQPDEAHFKFFGHYNPVKFGQKGYRSKPFKDDGKNTRDDASSYFV